MTPDDPRTQAEIDADVQQLRDQLISVINQRLAHRLRGMAFLAETTPAAIFDKLLYDAFPLLDVADAALAFTDHPTDATTHALVDACDRLRQEIRVDGHPEYVGIRAAQAVRALNGGHVPPR